MCWYIDGYNDHKAYLYTQIERLNRLRDEKLFSWSYIDGYRIHDAYFNG